MFIGYEAPVASAQVLYGSIVGTVTDRAGSVVPKTVVKVTSTTTGLSREATADSAGYYSISNLPQGDYELSATATGFKPLTQKGVRSEERRVGKECRSRWGQYHEKKKQHYVRQET